MEVVEPEPISFNGHLHSDEILEISSKMARHFTSEKKKHELKSLIMFASYQ